MVLFWEHGMCSLQVHSCWKYNLIPPSLQSWKSSEWVRTIETCSLTGLKKKWQEKCTSVLWLFNSCYSIISEILCTILLQYKHSFTSECLHCFHILFLLEDKAFCIYWIVRNMLTESPIKCFRVYFFIHEFYHQKNGFFSCKKERKKHPKRRAFLVVWIIFLNLHITSE